MLPALPRKPASSHKDGVHLPSSSSPAISRSPSPDGPSSDLRNEPGGLVSAALVTVHPGNFHADRILCLCDTITTPSRSGRSGGGGVGAGRVLSADLPGEGAGVVGVQKRHAPGRDVGGGQLDLAGGPPPAGAADPQRPAGILLAEYGGGIWRAGHAEPPIERQRYRWWCL